MPTWQVQFSQVHPLELCFDEKISSVQIFFTYRVNPTDHLALLKDIVIAPLGKTEMIVCQIDLQCYPVSKNISFLKARNENKVIQLARKYHLSNLGYYYYWTFSKRRDFSISRDLRQVNNFSIFNIL